jgi:hypothetical protein
VGHLLHSWITAIIRGEFDFNLSWLGDIVVLASVLIAKGMSSNDDGRGPAWDAPWNVGDDDWLSEDGTIEDVSNGSIGAAPHLFEPKLLHSTLVWGNGGTLDGDLVLLGGLSGINSDLVIGSISAGH